VKIVIIGSVAAGTSVAAKARRNTETAEIVVYDRDRDISYSGCGLPYYVGGEVDDLEDLRPRDAAWFAKRYHVAIHTRHEVLAVDHGSRTLTVHRIDSGETITDDYDVLVLATGVSSIVPPLGGVDAPGVFTLRSPGDAEEIRAFADRWQPKRSVIVGAGYIGLEMAEQLSGRGVDVTIVEAQPHAMPRLDPDMSARVDEELRRNGVTLRTGSTVASIAGDISIPISDSDRGRSIRSQFISLRPA
jgi:NADPH-dependent 2,4-dienoyl-CoA reductase/sulfur reductase-like enzyme